MADRFLSKSRGTEFGSTIMFKKSHNMNGQQLVQNNRSFRGTVPSAHPDGRNVQEKWSVDFILKQLLGQPRTQFNIYYNGKMLPAMQREVVQYRTESPGSIRRTELSRNHGEYISPQMLKSELLNDLERFRDCFFTFMSMPTIGIVARSENRDYLSKYQVTYPQPITSIVQ